MDCLAGDLFSTLRAVHQQWGLVATAFIHQSQFFTIRMKDIMLQVHHGFEEFSANNSCIQIDTGNHIEIIGNWISFHVVSVGEHEHWTANILQVASACLSP